MSVTFRSVFWRSISGFKKWVIRFPFILIFVIGLWLLFYPNDARLPDVLPATDVVDVGKSTLGFNRSLLRGELLFDASPSVALLGEEKNAWATQYPALREAFDVRVQINSARFIAPLQVRLSLGVYPARVVARDGIFVSAGGTLTVKSLVTSGGLIRFGVAGISGSNSFEATVNGTPLISWKESLSFSELVVRLTGQLAPDWTRSLIKGYVQFIRPGSATESFTGRRWHDFSAVIPRGGDNSSDLVLSCGPGGPCIFSDLTFSPNSSTNESTSAQRPQNFIVVLVDTLRSDAVISPTAPAPFQHFVSRSAAFSGALSPGNMTSPSTNALLGCHTPTEINGIAFAYAVHEDAREAHYRSGITSFPKVFSDRGYDTAMIGNISVISEVIGAGVSHGFNEDISIETEGYETALAARDSVRWIRSHKRSPFFLYIHLNAPHAPYRAPLSDIFEMWPGRSALNSYRSVLKWLYRAEVNYAARAFSEILKAVESESLESSTNVILLADHGDQHATRIFHGNESGPAYEGAFFDHGATLNSDEVAVPLVWRGPGVVPSMDRAPVSTIGLGAAMLGRAGIADNSCGVSSREAGERLTSTLVGKDSRAEGSVFGIEGYQQRAVVVDARWKYIRAHEPTQKTLVPPMGWMLFPADVFIREEIYDLDLDPLEVLNLGQDQNSADLIARCRREYERFYKVNTGFELIIESPRPDLIRVPYLKFESTGKSRVVLPLADKTPMNALQVFVGGQPVKIGSMAWRLPLAHSHWPLLPREIQGDGSLLSATHVPSAYLRRVPVNDTEVRRIVTGNPMFDQILREWGYLHDD